MRDFLAVVNALADESRLRLLMSLHDCELCVCQLVDFIELADSTVSKHMSVLRQAGLVESRKKGRWVYYRLAGGDASLLVRRALEFARLCLAGDGGLAKDRVRIAEMLRKDDGTMCQPDAVQCAMETSDLAMDRHPTTT